MDLPAQVLVVEDDTLIAAALEDILSDAGFRVLTCCSGEEATAELDRDVKRFQVILTDVRMPGLSGWDVAHRARELASDMPVIYVTGDSSSEWASKSVPNSVLIHKPYASAQIITAVSNLLNRTDVA
jgi:DNA-binding response OmpR family regulator